MMPDFVPTNCESLLHFRDSMTSGTAKNRDSHPTPRHQVPQGRHIVLLMHRWVGYLHGVQLGIAEYLMHHPAMTASQYFPEPDQLQRVIASRVDGIIMFSAW